MKNNENINEQILEFIQKLSSSLNLQFILDKITEEQTLNFLNTKDTTIYLLDSNKEFLEPVATLDQSTESQVMSANIAVKSSLSGKVVKAKKGMIFNNASKISGAYQIPGTHKDMDEHLMVLPLLFEKEILGTLNLYRQNKLYTIKDLEIAEIFALYAGTAIQNALEHQSLVREIDERKQAEDYLKQQSKDQATLLEASKSLTISLDIETVLQNISDRSTRLVGLDTGAIYLINGEELYLGSATPKIPQDFPEVFRRTRLVEHPNIQKAISTRRPHILPDMVVADLSTAEQAIRNSRNMRTLIYVPLMIKKKALGVLILGTVKETRTFSKHEIDLYITFSHLAALSIQNAHLFNKTKQNVIELEQRIIERKHVEEKLKQSEELNRSITKSAADAIISIDDEGIIFSWNKFAEKIFGYSSSEIINKKLTKILPTRYKNAHTSGLDRLKSGGKGNIIGKTIGLEALNKDGTEFPIELSLSSWEANKKKYYTGIIRDITERIEAEEKLKSRNKELETWAEVTGGRELFMLNLKKEINELLEKYGEKPKYKIPV